MKRPSSLLLVLAFGLPACGASSELKSAVSAYAVAIDHYGTASKKLLAECLNPPPDFTEEMKKEICASAATGYDQIIASAKKLDAEVAGKAADKGEQK
jgi:hypothetical protein